mmetsp:Transcript_11676/g.40607  ORF Transcript_11676/g.40607 Transcript_11676/m.40607 type:complete len:392 (+) Transcript_11676:92-1267(+)
MEELKTLVTASLEKQGVLGKLKAELRAAVFAAVDEEGVRRGSPVLAPSSRARSLAESEEGAIALALVAELLEWAGLESSLKVYMPEAGADELYAGRDALEPLLFEDGDLQDSADTPLLLTLLAELKAKRKAGIGGGIPTQAADTTPVAKVAPAIDTTAARYREAGVDSPGRSDSPMLRNTDKETDDEDKNFSVKSAFVKDSSEDLFSTVRRAGAAGAAAGGGPAAALAEEPIMEPPTPPAPSLLGALPALGKPPLGASRLAPLNPLSGGRPSADLAPVRPSPLSNMSSASAGALKETDNSSEVHKDKEKPAAAGADEEFEIDSQPEEIISEDEFELEADDSEASLELGDEDPLASSRMASADLKASGLEVEGDYSGDIGSDIDLVESAELN